MKNDRIQPPNGRPNARPANDQQRLWHPLLLQKGNAQRDRALDITLKLKELGRS